MELPKTLKGVELRYAFGITGDWGAERTYRNNELGIQMNIYTPKVNGEWGEAKRYFFRDGDANEYATYEELWDAANKESEREES